MIKFVEFLKGLKKYNPIFICILVLLTFSADIQAGKPIKVVVIDAGHGGHDPGAQGFAGANEKDIALAVALNVGKRINQAFPDIKVIYTRKTDVFIELKQRAIIANENKADFFISIHCNAATNTTSYGTETYVMGMDKNSANLAVAQRENSSILLEANAKENYGDFNPTSEEAYIIFQLYQNVYSEQSIQLAKAIQDEFRTSIHRKDRGVKQAPILVLWRTAMPSILVETGFISNKEEEAYLVSQKGQDEISNSIFKGFAKIVEANNPSPIKTDVKEENNTKTSEKVENDTVVTKTKAEYKVCYKIQFATLTTKQNLSDSKFKNIKDIEIEKVQENIYRYTSGHFFTYQEAVQELEYVRNNGYKDAFVIAFDKKGQKITINEAKKIEKSK